MHLSISFRPTPRFGAWSAETLARRSQEASSTEMADIRKMNGFDIAQLLQQANNHLKTLKANAPGQSAQQLQDNDPTCRNALRKLELAAYYGRSAIILSAYQVAGKCSDLVIPDATARVLEARVRGEGFSTPAPHLP